MNLKTCLICGNKFDGLSYDKFEDICENCIDIITDTVKNEEEYKEEITFSKNKPLKPHILKKELDKYIIGQDVVKKKISVEICNHYKRVNYSSKEVELPKNNILLLGPSGSGKTYILEVLSKLLNVPLIIGDATSLTESGYVGKDVDTLLNQLIDKAEGDISLAERGIIYIDEIDKIAASKGDGGSKKVGEDGVQASLLKIIEGMEYTFEKTGQMINTKNILFVCGGAFSGITDIIEKRMCKKSTIGFSVKSQDEKEEIDKKALLHKVTTDDLVEYGLTTEFIGRFHSIATLDELSEKDLERILVEPKNSIIKQYKALFKIDGIDISFEEDVLKYIAEMAKKKGTGARGLKSVISDKLDNLIYEISEKEEDVDKYVVTKEYFIS